MVSTAVANLALYRDPVVARNIGRSDFRLADLMHHDKTARPQKDATGKVAAPDDMLVFCAGRPPIYGRQILHFLDPVCSRRASSAAMARQ